MSDASEPGTLPEKGFSWGGAGLVLLATSVIAYAALGKIIDGNVQIQDSTGRTLVYEGGSVGATLALLLVLAGAGCAVIGFLTGRLQRLLGSAFTVSLGLCLAWWLLGSVLLRRGDLGPVGLVVIGLGFVIALGVVASPPNRGTLLALNVTRDVAVVGSIALSLLLPSIGTLPCRADKCGVFGSMWTGFFFHENVAASAPLILLPLAVIYRAPWKRWAAFLLLAVLVLGSGSRTALLALAVAGALLILLPRWRRSGLPIWAAWAPLAAFVTSALFYLRVIPIELTGRDWVYSAVAGAMHGYAGVFGPGSPELAKGTGGWVVGEHGQAPHVLLQLGWVGFFLFLGAMVGFVRLAETRRPDHLLGAGVLLVPASRFVTEPSLMFETRTMEFAAMCLAMGLLASSMGHHREGPRERTYLALQGALKAMNIIGNEGAEDGHSGLGERVEGREQFLDVGLTRRDDEHRRGREQEDAVGVAHQR